MKAISDARTCAFIADKVINLVCGVFIFAVHAISRVTIYGCVVYGYIYIISDKVNNLSAVRLITFQS